MTTTINLNYSIITSIPDKIHFQINNDNSFTQGSKTQSQFNFSDKTCLFKLHHQNKSNSAKFLLTTNQRNVLTTYTSLAQTLQFIMKEFLMSEKEFVNEFFKNLDQSDDILKSISCHHKQLKSNIIQTISQSEKLTKNDYITNMLSNNKNVCIFLCKLLQCNISIICSKNNYIKILNPSLSNDDAAASKTFILLQENDNKYLFIDTYKDESELDTYLAINSHQRYYSEKELKLLKVSELKSILNDRHFTYPVKETKDKLIKMLL